MSGRFVVILKFIEYHNVNRGQGLPIQDLGSRRSQCQRGDDLVVKEIHVS